MSAASTSSTAASQDIPAPLEGIRVVDFTETLPGPFLTQSLVDLGAEVVKVERSPGGDSARSLAPGIYGSMNRGKRIVFLDLKDPTQRAEALELIGSADIVMEGFRPGVTKRLGIDYEVVRECNPKAIYVSLTGYGQTGPMASTPGHDINYLAAAGVTALSGRLGSAPEHCIGLPIADLSGSLYGLISVLAALQQRAATGRGQWLDVSFTDCLVHMMNPRFGHFGVDQIHSVEEQRRSVLLKPGYGIFETADGVHISLAALEDRFWDGFVKAVGLEFKDLDTANYAKRTLCSQAINQQIAECFRKFTAKDLCELLTQADVPFSEVVAPNRLPEHPQHTARQMFFETQTEFGPMQLARFPVRLEGMRVPAASAAGSLELPS